MTTETAGQFMPLVDIGFKGDADVLCKEKNIALLMSMEDRKTVGMWAREGYLTDKESRSKWEEWYAEAIKLAMQVKEAKSFPWPNCSNVKFPLLTVAVLNAHALAYPALIKGSDVVKGLVVGDDPDGEKSKRAERVGKHMSYQLLETLPWQEETDKQILIHFLFGTTFKKVYRDNAQRKNCSEFVMPKDLIINYFSRDMESCPRASHWIPMTRNELMENINAQIFLRPDEPIRTGERPTGALEEAQDKVALAQPIPNVGLVNYIIEQSCWMDLDQDGYDEPYAVTFDEQTGYLYRIHARYLKGDIERNKAGTILRIKAENYYQKYTLIPSPDGSAYGVGLGRLLAPITDSVDTIINQTIDAMTMKLLGGGFLGRGVRIRAGESRSLPYEWKPVDAMGDDLRKGIFPNPTNEIPTVLLDLLKFLIDYGERIASAGDIQMGKMPGQNTKAETASIANENGKVIFNSCYKRFWRDMHGEFKKFYHLNALYQEDEEFIVDGKLFKIQGSDYASFSSASIIPVADPNIVSKTDKKQAAEVIFQTAAAVGFAGHDMEQVIIRRYEAFDISDIPRIFPGLKAKPPQPNQKQIEAQAKMQLAQAKMMDIKQKNQVAVGKLLIQAKESNAKILKLTADAAKALQEAKGVDVGHQIALLQLQADAEVERRDDVLETIEILMETIKEGGNEQSAAGNGMEGMGQSLGNAKVSKVPANEALSGLGGLGQ